MSTNVRNYRTTETTSTCIKSKKPPETEAGKPLRFSTMEQYSVLLSVKVSITLRGGDEQKSVKLFTKF